MYKLITIDLDGTLLGSDGKISTNNINALSSINSKDIEIVINSGRQLYAVKNIIKGINNIRYCICGNGAIIYDVLEDRKIYENLLDKSIALEIIKMCKQNKIYYSVYTNDEILAESFQDNILVFNKENEKKSKIMKTKIVIKKDIIQYIEKHNSNILKIGISDSQKAKFEAVNKKLIEFYGINVMEVEGKSQRTITETNGRKIIEYFYTEVTSLNTNKWFAIDKLIKRLNIQHEEVAAIGDNINDKEMIQNAGLGIAMGNATPYIQSIADRITVSNDEDGVSYAINKYIMNKNVKQ